VLLVGLVPVCENNVSSRPFCVCLIFRLFLFSSLCICLCIRLMEVSLLSQAVSPRQDDAQIVLAVRQQLVRKQARLRARLGQLAAEALIVTGDHVLRVRTELAGTYGHLHFDNRTSLNELLSSLETVGTSWVVDVCAARMVVHWLSHASHVGSVFVNTTCRHAGFVVRDICIQPHEPRVDSDP